MSKFDTSHLSEEQVIITQKGGTEKPFSSDLLNEKRKGDYVCAVCNHDLFNSQQKFDSGSGWPSFFAANENSIKEKDDFKLAYRRTEAICSNCGAHLGHIFEDGPEPTGLRYCINGLALNFRPQNN